MRRMIAVVMLGAMFAWATAPTKAESPSMASHAKLDDSFSQLRDDFNSKRGHVRLLFVVDSACPMCLKGLADIDEALLASTKDTRLDTFVVHVPVIGGTEAHIAPATALTHNDRVKHYWNASGEFGGRLSAVAELSSGDEFMYAWDVWLSYGPEATWEGRDPPKPDVLMHQLPGLRGRAEFPRLDADDFAAEVRKRLETLPQASSGNVP